MVFFFSPFFGGLPRVNTKVFFFFPVCPGPESRGPETQIKTRVFFLPFFDGLPRVNTRILFLFFFPVCPGPKSQGHETQIETKVFFFTLFQRAAQG
jgi:hypothetical protein